MGIKKICGKTASKCIVTVHELRCCQIQLIQTELRSNTNYEHSHREDGCPTPSTLAIRLVQQILELFFAIALFQVLPPSGCLPPVTGKAQETRQFSIFPQHGNMRKSPHGIRQFAELALRPKSTEWGNHPLYDYAASY